MFGVEASNGMMQVACCWRPCPRSAASQSAYRGGQGALSGRGTADHCAGPSSCLVPTMWGVTGWHHRQGMPGAPFPVGLCTLRVMHPVMPQPRTTSWGAAESGKRHGFRPLLSEPDVHVSLHPAQASHRPCEGPVSRETTCWLHETAEPSIPSAAPGNVPWTAGAFAASEGKGAPGPQSHRHVPPLLGRFHPGSRAETPQGSRRAFAPGAVAPRLHPMTGRHALFPTPIPAPPLVRLTAFLPSLPPGRDGLPTFHTGDHDG